MRGRLAVPLRRNLIPAGNVNKTGGNPGALNLNPSITIRNVGGRLAAPGGLLGRRGQGKPYPYTTLRTLRAWRLGVKPDCRSAGGFCGTFRQYRRNTS
jgi:hypothetical protein